MRAFRAAREKKRRRVMEDFADAVLPLNGAWPLDAYRLRVRDDLHLRKAMDRWIRRGLARGPELRVAFDYDRHGAGYNSCWKEPPAFRFSIFDVAVTGRLRRLYLSGLVLLQGFPDELRSECPLLEDLQLVNCVCTSQFLPGNRRSLIRIGSRSLKRLVIEGTSSLHHRLCLTAPALDSLSVDTPLAVEDGMRSLAVASISCHAGVLLLLKSLCSASALELRRFTTRALVEEEPELFHEYHNLRTLVLTDCEIGDGCQVVAHVLKSIPNLERLVLQDCMISGSCMMASRRGAALRGCCQNLKSIRVKYEGHDVAHVPVAELRGKSKDAVKLHYGERPTSSVEWHHWLKRIALCSSHAVHLSQRYLASITTGPESDEEHESTAWKHRASKKHARDSAIKARRRGHLDRF
ncbi:MEIOTIC F-BOX protein MOF-like [Triticum aestivum]|uniref:MEIOTIC F-BOX protein MOF-like n=1 Tax=Triticum aestivum TaxID=4565 RepID=UPI001D00EEC7|nr:MEIOTIC F-BOX protein MOF-like [Triticum aestivum]